MGHGKTCIKSSTSRALQRGTDLPANLYFLSNSDILYTVSIETIQINLNVYKCKPFCYKNALNFLEPRYSWTFFDSQPKCFLIILKYNQEHPLGLEKPELNQPLSQIKNTQTRTQSLT